MRWKSSGKKVEMAPLVEMKGGYGDDGEPGDGDGSGGWKPGDGMWCCWQGLDRAVAEKVARQRVHNRWSPA